MRFCHELLGLLQLLLRGLEGAEQGDQLLERGLLFGQLLKACQVCRHLRLGHEAIQLFEAVFDGLYSCDKYRFVCHDFWEKSGLEWCNTRIIIA